jgi:lipopolysaccharide transport system ATP-binding protein
MKIIEVKNLSKSYQIGKRKESYYSLRDEMVNLAKKPFQWLTGQRENKEKFWALKDVSFSIGQGEVVGVIGRNGAGKTTLLKILSRITPPTEGEAIIRGRVNSLLEVGTGFHPELNGRENIYLNGAILGMRKKEIDSKFDEIVKFAEIEKFLDTPVKRYSSGMYVRLAFAIAAHLEPEILLVDEVLAVGDYKFQKKCLKKMSKVSSQGRTVLFVSHNMASVAQLCSRAILLDAGKIVAEGTTPDVIERYIGLRKDIEPEVSWKDPAKAPGGATVKLKSVRILSDKGKPSSELDMGKDFFIELCYWNFTKGMKLLPSIYLINSEGIAVLTAANITSACLKPDPWYGRPSPQGLFRSVCRIPGNLLNEGQYFINVSIADSDGMMVFHVFEREIISFEMVETEAMRKEYGGNLKHSKNLIGVVRPRLAFGTEYLGPLK